MNAIVAPPLRKYQHPVLQGLADKSLTALFNAGVIKQIAARQWLFRAGEAAQADVLFLDGSASVHRSDAPGELVVQLFAGDAVAATMLQQDGYRTHDCLATQAVTVLLLESAAVQQLDDNLQLTLQRNLHQLSGKLCHQLLQRSHPQRQQATVDAAAVQALLGERQQPYLETSPLQSMLANLPRLPPYSTRITALLSDPKASTRHIVEIARQDPSMTASVLKTVNSAWFGLAHKIKDFQHAVMMLGFTQMQQLLINMGVQSTMPNTPEFRQLQAHSMMISILCGEISLTQKLGSAPMLSTLGILHDIGKSVVLLLKRQHPKQDFLLGQLDSDMVGMLLLREWQIPDQVSNALQYQGWAALLPPDAVPSQQREAVAVLHIAHRCLDRLRSLQTEAPSPCPCRPWLQEIGSREQTLDDYLLGKLIPSMVSRSTPLPLALQDLVRKAQQLVGFQSKVMATAP